ncbi:MAG TPA: phosphonate C-P lyase system protein PhnL [Aliidongia sp.]|uniref:phosphonate C-P lyase system protein PhnL n=1 Tax=Aliidongia sp. TaxID=1914230 RepID=UPI002DDCB65C|nr:phosphonate C-P lyase system protein PhnL [Aliidongia sp.]HEV2675567.1 phosphonate C-P lyase system protein PhnL [Aliidongia sp.]
MEPVLEIRGLAKSFTLHNQGGVTLPVLAGVDLVVHAGECVALHGRSGTGKSTLLRTLQGNYRVGSGHVWIRHGAVRIDLAAASPRQIIELRRGTIGYVSQFLRVIPRVPALDIVAEPMRARGDSAGAAGDRAAALLTRLNVPERLWHLAPATFSGGEQQRVNIARGFAVDYPILLLDEPTASLDGENRAAVIGLIDEALARGTAIIGIFHDGEVRDRVASRLYDMVEAKAAA